jgi:hypothetical protein
MDPLRTGPRFPTHVNFADLQPTFNQRVRCPRLALPSVAYVDLRHVDCWATYLGIVHHFPLSYSFIAGQNPRTGSAVFIASEVNHSITSHVVAGSGRASIRTVRPPYVCLRYSRAPHNYNFKTRRFGTPRGEATCSNPEGPGLSLPDTRPRISKYEPCAVAPLTSAIPDEYHFSRCWFVYWPRPRPGSALVMGVGTIPGSRKFALIYSGVNVETALVRLQGSSTMRPKILAVHGGIVDLGQSGFVSERFNLHTGRFR